MEDDSFDQATNDFLTWLGRQPGAVISPDIRVADLRGRRAGRGVVATAPIPAHAALFTIPTSAILTYETSGLSSKLRTAAACSTSPIPLPTDPWSLLILSLIDAHLQGTRSPWHPYLALFPASFDTLMFWTADELPLLQGSAVVDKISRRSADANFRAELLPVIRGYSGSSSSSHDEGLEATAAGLSLFPGAEKCSEEELLALCHRMGSVIMAYAFDLEKPGDDGDGEGRQQQQQEEGEGEREEWTEDVPQGGEEQEKELQQHTIKSLIPLADLLNADADKNNAKLFHEPAGSTVTMKALRPIAPGEEIFNDYGALPSADVLRRYGYVTAGYAKYDVVEVGAEMVRRVATTVEQGGGGGGGGKQQPQQKQQALLSEEDCAARWAYLESHGVVDDGFDIARKGGGGAEEGQQKTDKHNNDDDDDDDEEEDEHPPQFPDDLLITLNTLVLAPADFALLQRKDKLPKPALNPASARLLHGIVEARAEEYPADGAGHADRDDDGQDGDDDVMREIDDDHAAADDEQTSHISRRRRAMARQVIRGEKTVLREAAETLAAFLTEHEEREAAAAAAAAAAGSGAGNGGASRKRPAGGHPAGSPQRQGQGKHHHHQHGGSKRAKKH